MSRSTRRVVRTLRTALTVACLAFATVFGSRSDAQSLNVTLRANVHDHINYNDVWGYSAPDGTELAILGRVEGTSFVDVTDPDVPVEVLNIPGALTIWRDIKVYDHYAYIVDDAAGEGLVVVDLSDPSAPVEVARYTDVFTTAHNAWVDEEAGLLFCCGSDGGTHVFDLVPDPVAPVYLHTFSDFYVHDLFTQDDVAYFAAIGSGVLATGDLTGLPGSIPVLDTAPSDDRATHNAWTTDDGNYTLTTDERSGGHLTIFDTSDPTEVSKVAEYHHPTDPTSVIHNVVLRGDLAFVSWYTAGLEIVDIADPRFPSRVGFYDTYPGSGPGFSGAWGVYPLADSGLIYISDIQTGLYVVEFDPNYGAVEGMLRDAVDNDPVANAVVTLVGENRTVVTGADGFFRIASPPGNYILEIEAYAYEDVSENIAIAREEVVELEIPLPRVPSARVSGTVFVGDPPVPTEGIRVDILDTPQSVVSAADGTFAFEFVPAGPQTLRASLLGFGATEAGRIVLPDDPLAVDLLLGPSVIYDDLEGETGWTVGATGDDALTGIWERVDPVGTRNGTVQPEDDHTPSPGTMCFVTGQGENPLAVDENDVDDGTTTLVSPTYDLTDVPRPQVRYFRWYVNDLTTIVDDEFHAEISSNGGVDWVRLETLTESRPFWEEVSFYIEDFITPTDQVRFRFIASDLEMASIVEAAIDDLEVFGEDETSDAPGLPGDPGLPDAVGLLELRTWPRPVSGEGAFQLQLDGVVAGPVNWSLVDISGRRIWSADSAVESPLHGGALRTSSSDLGLPTGRLGSGVYFLRAEQAGRTVSARIRVTR